MKLTTTAGPTKYRTHPTAALYRISIGLPPHLDEAIKQGIECYKKRKKKKSKRVKMEAGLESIPSFYFSLENPIFLTKNKKQK